MNCPVDSPYPPVTVENGARMVPMGFMLPAILRFVAIFDGLTPDFSFSLVSVAKALACLSFWNQTTFSFSLG